MISEPKDRFNRINNLVESLSKINTFIEWNMKVNETFANIKTK